MQSFCKKYPTENRTGFTFIFLLKNREGSDRGTISPEEMGLRWGVITSKHFCSMTVIKRHNFPFEVITPTFRQKPFCMHFLFYFQELGQLYQLNICGKNIQILRELKPMMEPYDVVHIIFFDLRIG